MFHIHNCEYKTNDITYRHFICTLIEIMTTKRQLCLKLCKNSCLLYYMDKMGKNISGSKDDDHCGNHFGLAWNITGICWIIINLYTKVHGVQRINSTDFWDSVTFPPWGSWFCGFVLDPTEIFWIIDMLYTSRTFPSGWIVITLEIP